MKHSSMYGNHSAHPSLHLLSPADEYSQSTTGFLPTPYGSIGMHYGYTDSNSWRMSPSSADSSSQQGTGSFSSLLNPSDNQYSRGSLQTTYSSPFSSVPLQINHSVSSLSPDSRPTTGYSLSSMSSFPYDTESTSTSISHDYPPGLGPSMIPWQSHSLHESSLAGSPGGGISSGYSSSNTSYGIGVGGSAVHRQKP
ncbi:hypothetical protein DFH11DRAFT_973876 [Phellopilus nigrolimitatus]|nr:hypothetical protein DFH11DRAFT_973876 [Phellopilus nigrolimitatus]